MESFHARALFVNAPISSLPEVKVIIIDATYGTKSKGMKLCAVLAELDGIGIPLGCLLIHACVS